MGSVKKGVVNQAMGLIPLLLLMFLDNYLPYFYSFVLSACLGIISLCLFKILKKRDTYYFILNPVGITLLLYSLFLALQFSFILHLYLPLVIEILLVLSLFFVGIFKNVIFQHIRLNKENPYKLAWQRLMWEESLYIAKLIQFFYTLHLFGLLLYGILPESMKEPDISLFLYRKFGFGIGVLIVVYGQIRFFWMNKALDKEMWLPVLNNKGNVVGRVAYSVSDSLPKDHFLPVVRVAVIYKGMFYLVHQGEKALFFPDKIDYPFSCYLQYSQTMEKAVQTMISGDDSLKPRFLVRYIFENEKLKHWVSLFVLRIQTEKSFEQIKKDTGKLWTVKQIEENLNSGIFSDYLKEEFGYLQSTVLFVENLNK